jgi:hypothetical protein
MIPIKNIATKINRSEYRYNFSICTLVNRVDQYQKMLKSFIDAGFSQERCEYLFIDNSEENNYDAYAAFNIFLQRAQGKYIIICHQDIELIYDKIDDLEQRIDELEKLDPKWALIGNAGGINLKFRSGHITHGNPPIHVKKGKYFPQKVQTLDENFILVKKQANLAVSSDLAGFHFYGTDICLIADILGFNAYVVDFHMYHQSTGNKDKGFLSMKMALQRKYQRALKGHYLLAATSEKIFISGNKFSCFILNTSLSRAIAKKYYELRLLLTNRY